MRTAKKVLSLLLTLAMVLGMFCVPAAAASAGTITLSLVFAADKNGNTEIDSLDAAGDFYALVNFSGAVTSNPIGNYNIFVKYPNTITGSSVVKKAGLAEPTYKQNGQIASAGFSDNEGVYDEEGENPATEGTLFVIKCTANAAIDDLASSIYFLEQAETQSGTAVAKIKDIDGGEYALAGIPMELGELTLDPASVTVNGSLATDAVTAAPTVSSAGGSAISLDSVDITVTKNEITYDWYDNGVITVPNDAVAGDYTVTAEANASDLLGSATATLTVARAASTPASTAPQAATVALPTAADNKDAELPLTAKDQFGDAMTSGVDYALKSQIEGVSIDGSTAKVSLAAKSNTFPVTVAYTATANGVTVESSFQITREASAVVPRTIVIGVDQETLVIPTDDTSVTATFTATAQDQYGDNLAPTVTAWEITAGKVASVDIEGGTITVTKDAANDIPDSKTMTVTATIGGEAYTKDVTVARAASVPTTIAISGGPSDTILIPANGEADAAVDAFAATVKDQYGKKLDSAQVNWAISDIKIDGASVTADGITLDAVSNAAKAQIARGKTATVTVTAISADDTSLSETATFTVARAASVAKTIQITDEAGNAVSGTDIIGIPGSKQYAAPVYDQYGDEMASATLTLGSTAGFELSGSTVSVAADTQDEASVTLTASYDTKEETLTIQARSVSFDWPVAVEGGIAYGDSRQSAFGESWKDTAKATAYIEGVPTELNGKFTIVDTAGMRKKGKIEDVIERYSMVRALSAIERADVCVIMIDATEGVTEQDTRIAGLAHDSGKASVFVINKWDLIEKETGTMEAMERVVKDKFAFMDYAPVIFISAKTGQRVDKLFKLIVTVNENASKRLTTGILNQMISQAVTLVPTPQDKGRHLKIYYGTQVSVKPPTFALFVNDKKLSHFSYERYLENQLRSNFGFEGVPIRLLLRNKNGSDE